MRYLFLCVLFLASLISVSIFIDRIFLSNKGFKSFWEFTLTSICVFGCLPTFLLGLIWEFPYLINLTQLWVLLLYHLISFIIINFIFVTITYSVFLLDHFIKNKVKIIKLSILTCNYLSYKNLLSNKKFLILSIGISYLLTCIVILFPIPPLILSAVGSDPTLITLAKSEIQTYQQLFVFSSIPILFSLMKNK